MTMKKTLALLLALLLVCGLVPGALAQSDGADRLGEKMPDFSAATLDGSVFTLSEALKEKELVLVNLWATWCPPCRLEFPFMEAAYEKYQDKVAVIALSVEPTDTMEKLRAFAQERGITFLVGRDESGLSDHFNVTGIPTSVAVDRFGNVVYVGVGCLIDETLFTNLFDQFLGDEYTQTQVRAEEITVADNYYAALFIDENLSPVPGCMVSFCTDTACTTAVSNAQGTASFTGDPQVYHIQIIKLPEGYHLLDESEQYTERTGGITPIIIAKDAQ